MDFVSIAAVAGGMTTIAVLAYVCYKYGRISVLKEQAQENAKVSKDQLDAAVNSDSAIDSLLEHKF